MTGKSPATGKPDQQQTRDERLKAALKANLGRRKAQARARNKGDNKKDDNNKG